MDGVPLVGSVLPGWLGRGCDGEVEVLDDDELDEGLGSSLGVVVDSVGELLWDSLGLADGDAELELDWTAATAFGAVALPTSTQPRLMAATRSDRRTHGAMG